MQRTIAQLIEERFGLPTTAGHSMPAHGTIARQLAHRSVRRFSDRDVDEELMEVLLSAALSAPSKSDLQQATIVNVVDAAQRAAIGALVPSMPWIAQAPAMLVFCGDNLRMRRMSQLRGKPYPNDTLDTFMNAAVDAAMVMQAFITAAEAAGLGCCPISQLRNRIGELAGLLQLPEAVFPVAGLCVGYPAEPGRISMRLPMSLTVHRNFYRAGGFEAELAAYDERRATKEPPVQGKQKYVQRWGTVPFYTWSEDKARMYSVAERDDFGAFIRNHGFSLK